MASNLKTETSVGIFILLGVCIFFYMSLQIGVWRFDSDKYSDYILYFRDVSGLTKKANVQIAGVKVGWVEEVSLVNIGKEVLVRAQVMVLKTYPMHADAYGMIRQDGLLGTKYIELFAGDLQQKVIPPGGTLTHPSQDASSIDEILFRLQGMLKNLESVSESFRDSLGGTTGARRIENAIDSFTAASNRIAQFAEKIDRVIGNNEEDMHEIITNVRALTDSLKNDFPAATREVRESFTKVANSIERELERFTTTFESAAKPFADTMGKVTDGKGVLGTLLNDEDMSHNVKIAVDGVKKYFGKIDKLAIQLDGHGETMYGLGNKIDFRDSKGYFNVKIYPQEDFFYQLGLVGTYSGTVDRWREYRTWKDEQGYPIEPDNLPLSPRDTLRFAPERNVQIRHMDKWLCTAQFGKTFEPFTLRCGLFDSTVGVGVDLQVPLDMPRVAWTTTFEAFDFMGRNRIDDKRIHLKWLNSINFANSLYMVFGADDIISKTNRNAFFGVGFSFADDDLKYYISKVNMPA